jgi:hypothetical protein
MHTAHSATAISIIPISYHPAKSADKQPRPCKASNDISHGGDWLEEWSAAWIPIRDLKEKGQREEQERERRKGPISKHQAYPGSVSGKLWQRHSNDRLENAG